MYSENISNRHCQILFMSKRTVYRCQDLRTLAKDLFDAYGIRDWKFAFDRAKTRAGVCDYDTKTISLSIHFVENPKTTWHHLTDILLHEIAHALTPDTETHHDETWRDMAKSIGCSGNPYAPHTALKPRYRLRCPCKAVDFRRHRVHEAYMNTICAECEGEVIICQ